jgi:hypothetical protein
LTLRLWRISKRKYADTAFSGEGARRVGGRWNSRGQGMVYTSGTLSLALTFPVIFSRAKSDGKIEAQKPYCLVRNQSKILVQQGFTLILEVPPSKESRT